MQEWRRIWGRKVRRELENEKNYASGCLKTLYVERVLEYTGKFEKPDTSSCVGARRKVHGGSMGRCAANPVWGRQPSVLSWG